jgi:RNA polymerase sigma factor (TIGR02999 family)
VDHARARAAAKRGNGQAPLPLDEVHEAAPASTSWIDLIDLDRALANLARCRPRCARVVELLYFGGLTPSEAGGLLGVTERTIERDWCFGRAWLLRALGGRSRS